MLVGTLAACAHGAAMPVMMIVFGDMSDLFIYNAQWETITQNLATNISSFCGQICYSRPSVTIPDFTAGWIWAVTSPSQPLCTPGLSSNVSTSGPFNATATAICGWCVNVTAEYINQNIDKVM
jgi:hypothetical protein